MNILQVSGGYNQIPPIKGGPQETVIYNISKAMVKLGHNVTIIDRKHSRIDKSIEYDNGIEIIRLENILNKMLHLEKIGIPGTSSCFEKIGISGISSCLVKILHIMIHETIFFMSVNRFIKKNACRFDVIHVHFPSLGLLLIIFNRDIRKKMIYTSHQTIWSLERPSILGRTIFIPIESFLMRNIRKVTVLNESIMSKMISAKKVNKENISVVTNGVDIDLFNSSKDSGYVRTKYKLEETNILFVGRITYIKGVEYLIKAANIIVNDIGYKNVAFILSGPLGTSFSNTREKDKYVCHMLDLIDSYDLRYNVRLIGPIPLDDLIALYRECDIFVLPSLGEGFGLVVTEAMASGMPIIGTDIIGIRDQVVNSWNGILIDPANDTKLAEKIKYLIDFPTERKKMGKNSRKLAEDIFDWNIICKKLEEIYLG